MSKKLIVINILLWISTVCLFCSDVYLIYTAKYLSSINNKFYYDCEGNELKGLNPDLIQLFIYNYCVILNEEDSIKLNEYMYTK